MSASRPMPMFPLGTVLFPYGELSLVAFELRYRALVADCLRSGWQFGVVLIERGHEVGGGDERFGVGTIAHIREAGQYGDGRWALTTVGTHRVRIDAWLPDDPYPLALVTDIVEPDERPADESLARAESAVRRALALRAELGEPGPDPATPLDEEPEIAAWELAAMAPLSPMDQQRVLEAGGPDARMDLLARLADEAADVLAFRMQGR